MRDDSHHNDSEPQAPDDTHRSPDPKNKSPWVQFGRYSQLAFMLPAGTVAGYLVGALLDRWLHTSWISIVGLLLGTAGGLIELIRTISRDTE
jgi:F0F1-type ATP synthase assembly protein I